jgi:hypothetical protein
MQESRFWPLGNPGEDVPTVDVANLKSVWSFYRDVEARNPGGGVGVAVELTRGACSAGSDIRAIWYRSALLQMLEMFPGELLARWKRSGRFDEAVFRVAATIPMKWMEGGVPQSHLPFDLGAFMRELQKDSP